MAMAADWDLLQSLHAVLEAGSFSAAARIRRLTQPTLGRHIDQLERQLGAPLFLRSPRGLQPTDLALAFRPHLADRAAAAAAGLRDVSGLVEGEQGVVRVTASIIMGVEVLPAILTRFREAHPGIDIEVTLSNANSDLTRREADVAVRTARPTQNALVARKVGEVGLGFFATADYLERHGAPATFDELDQHALIGFDRFEPGMVADFSLGRPISRDMFAWRSDDDAAQFAALKAGFGIGVCQIQLGRRAGLIPVLPDAFAYRLEIWICMHETLRGSPRMRLMFDHLAKAFAAYAAEAG
jgi:DNA-binding transcriptional LysR family regulator